MATVRPEHNILIAMGYGPKPNGSSPPSMASRLGSNQPNLTQAPDPQSSGKVSQDEAGYLDDQMCGACTHFTKETGDCAKVEGKVEACGGCKLYEAANTSPDYNQDDALTVGAPPAGAMHGTI